MSITPGIQGTRGLGPFQWIDSFRELGCLDFANDHRARVDENLDGGRRLRFWSIGVTISATAISGAKAFESNGVFDRES